MKIVVPLAGRGSRFATHGVETPKPLLTVAGRPMVAWAFESVKDLPHTDLVFVALAEHEQRFGVTRTLRSLAGEQAHIILLDQVTEGQLCTVLAARDIIDADEDVLIASADTYVVSPLAQTIAARRPECAGIISVARLPGEQWSFARTDESGRVVEVAEKVRISDTASTGLYYFNNGRQLVQIADEMLTRQEKTRGEYYVIPVYQKYLQRGWRVDISLATEVWDMGMPSSLAAFEQHLAQSGRFGA